MTQVMDMLLHPLVWPIALALAAGAVGYALSRLAPAAAKATGLLSALAVLAGGIALWAEEGPLSFSWTWMELSGEVRLTMDLAVSPLGMLVVIGGAAFTVLISIYSLRAMAGSYWEGKFHAYLSWALAGTCLVGLAGNLLVLLLGWELVTLMLFLMVNQGRARARDGAAKAYAMLGFADACLLLALALLATRAGGSDNWSLSSGPMDLAAMGAAGYVIYVLILLAALAKAGAIPLHTWIPAVAADAPAPAVALLPGALDKLLGAYLLAVLSFRLFAPDSVIGGILMAIGCLTLLGAGMMALTQNNLYRALAFDAVSQVGYITIGMGCGAWLLDSAPLGQTAGGAEQQRLLAGLVLGGAMLHALNHAIYKSALFLVAGTAERACGSAEMDRTGGLARAMPVTFVAALVAALAAAGIPPLNGFASKWLVFEGALAMGSSGGPGWASWLVLVVAVFASAISLAVFVKILHAVFLAPPPAGMALNVPTGRWRLELPPMLAAVACVVLGLWPQPVLRFLVSGFENAGPRLDLGAGPAMEFGPIGLWSPTQATGLMLLGILLGIGLLGLARRGARVRLVRPFLGGEIAAPGEDRFRMPATHFYQTIRKLPLVGPLLHHGQAGAMDPYHWSARHGKRLVELLRSQHTGLISLYVAWVVVGLTVTLAYLLLSTGG